MRAKGPTIRLLDQGLFSLGNIAVVALVSHFASSAVTGSIIVLLVVYPVATALVQGYIVDFHLVFAHGQSAYSADRAWRGALIAGVPCSLLIPVLLLISDGGGNHSDAVTAAIVLFLALPGLTAQYAGRAWCLATGRPMVALKNDAAWLVGQALIFLLSRELGMVPSTAAIVSWCVAGNLCGLAFTVGLNSSPSGRRPTAEVFRMRSKFAGELVLGQTSAQINLVLLGALIGLAPLAGYRIAQLVLGPMLTSIAALRHVLLPRYAAIFRETRNPRDVARVAGLHAALVAGALQAGAAVIWLVPESVGRSIFGDSWLGARNLVMLVGLDMAMAGAGVVLALCLRALLLATGGLVVRLVISGLQVAAVLLACLLFTSATAVAVAGALASIVGVLLYVQLIRATLRATGDDQARTLPGRHRRRRAERAQVAPGSHRRPVLQRRTTRARRPPIRVPRFPEPAADHPDRDADRQVQPADLSPALQGQRSS